MRRLLAVTAVAVTLLAGAGCSADRADTAGSATPPTGGSAPSGGTLPGLSPGAGAAPDTAVPGGSASPAGGNGREVCAAASKAGSAAVQTYVSELGRMLTAVGANDTKGAEAAKRRAEAALSGWRVELARQAALATDPRLRTVLGGIAGEVATMKADINSIDSDKLDKLQQRLDQLCAG